MTLDEICPVYIAAKVIRLALATTDTPRAFSAIDLTTGLELEGDIGKLVEARGLSKLIELTVTAPSPVNFFRHVYRRGLPSSVNFTPKEGGRHLVRVAEVGHNLWWGALLVDVQGEQVDPRT